MRDNDLRWYSADADRSGGLLSSKFQQLLTLSRHRLELDRFYYSLYYDRSHQGFGAQMSAAEAFLDGMREKLNENIVFRIVQTLSAKCAKQKPKPTVITDGANWDLQQRAKQYDKFIWGTLHDQRIYEEQRSSDLGMFLTGTGAIYVGRDRDSIVCEAVPSAELFDDPAESRYGKPRSLYRRSFIDRIELCEQYPKHESEIMSAPAASVEDVFAATGRETADMVPVITGWRIGKPGRVVVTVGDTVLDEGEYTRKHFPFAFCRYAIAPEGMWGIGVVSQLVGLQVELNRTLFARQEALKKLGAPHWAIERGSKIVRAAISNRMTDIVEFTGTPPQLLTPGTIHPETFQHSDRIKSAMFQQGNVSEMAAANMKPAGLNSGKALRAYADMQDDALHDIFLRREQQILDVAELILDELEDLKSEGKEISTLYVGKFGTERVSFDDVEMDRDSFVLKVQPTSSLSTTLAGRLEDLMDMRELGLISDPAEMQELLQLPDLETASSRHTAMRDLLLEVLEVEILGKGNAVVPEPTWDLEMALRLCVTTRLRAQLKRAPESRIELLRVFEKQVIGYMQPPQETQSESAGMPQATPSGVPADIGAEDQSLVPPTPDTAGEMP